MFGGLVVFFPVEHVFNLLMELEVLGRETLPSS